jgi:hypothetical protein
MHNEKKKKTNCNNNKSYYSELESSKKWIICMSYLWFEWVQNDKLSKICKDAKNVPRKNASTSNGKMVIDVKIVTIKMNVVDVNVAIRNKIIEEHVL